MNRCKLNFENKINYFFFEGHLILLQNFFDEILNENKYQFCENRTHINAQSVNTRTL